MALTETPTTVTPNSSSDPMGIDPSIEFETDKPNRHGRLREFLLTASGVDKETLAETPSDLERYTGIGSLVMVATVMAFGSMTTALATIAGGGERFGFWAIVTLPIAALFALAIFAIDRFLVSQPGSPWPRLMLAAILMPVVAEPLLLFTFRQEINQHLIETQSVSVEDLTADINRTADFELDRIDAELARISPQTGELAEARLDLDGLDDEIANTRLVIEDLQTQLQAEVTGVVVGSSSGVAGDGPVADTIRTQIEFAENSLTDLSARRDRASARVDELTTAAASADTESAGRISELADQRVQVDADRRDDIAEAEQQVESSDGLLARVEALEELTQQSAGMFAGVWILRLLLFMFDISPMLAKLVTGRHKGPYEARMEAARKRQAIAVEPWPTPAPPTPALPGLAVGDGRTSVMLQPSARHQEAVISLSPSTSRMSGRVKATLSLDPVTHARQVTFTTDRDQSLRLDDIEFLMGTLVVVENGTKWESDNQSGDRLLTQRWQRGTKGTRRQRNHLIRWAEEQAGTLWTGR